MLGMMILALLQGGTNKLGLVGFRLHICVMRSDSCSEVVPGIILVEILGVAVTAQEPLVEGSGSYTSQLGAAGELS